jgi:hypothetical protein
VVVDIGPLLTRGTAMTAFAFYVLAFIPHFRHLWSRVWWSAGAVVFVVHVICAFHFVHHWSHVDAYAATARRTYELASLDWGGGVYFNYVFTVQWVVDVVWWWVSPVGHLKRASLISYALHGFMLFMWFNGTVVFGGPFARWVGVAGFVVLAGCWVGGRKRKAVPLE